MSQDSTAAQGAKPLPMVSPVEYCNARQHVFPSTDSWRWFVRQNRDELVKAGALLAPTSRLLVVPDKFDAAVQAIGQRLAATALR